LLKANQGINRVSTGQVINLPSFQYNLQANLPVRGLYDVPTPPGYNAPQPGLTIPGAPIEASSVFGNQRPAGSYNVPTPPGYQTGRQLPVEASSINPNATSIITSGSGQNAFTPSTTSPYAAEFKSSPERMSHLQMMYENRVLPQNINPYDAQRLGFDAQDLVRAGYRFDGSTATFVYAGSETGAGATPDTSGGGGGGPAPTRRQLTQWQKWENANRKRRLSWSDESGKHKGNAAAAQRKREKALREQFTQLNGGNFNWSDFYQWRNKNYYGNGQPRQDQSQPVAAAASGFGLISMNWRTSTG